MAEYHSNHEDRLTTSLSAHDADGITSMLIGNGELATTIGPTGFHDDPLDPSATAHQTQFFVWAGRRGPGAGRPLLDFGSLSRRLLIDRRTPTPVDWEQTLHLEDGIVTSRYTTDSIIEIADTFIPLHSNALMARVTIERTANRSRQLDYRIRYRLPRWPAVRDVQRTGAGVELRYTYLDQMGTIVIQSRCDDPDCGCAIDQNREEIAFVHRVSPNRSATIRVLLQFSDRVTFAFPLDIEQWDDYAATHRAGWRAYTGRSVLMTGNAEIDRLRAVGLYTIRAQLSPWSIGPTLSERYWGGGAFHDEMYPFYALLSGNHADLAARMPYFRLATLPQAQARARGTGALYPWSSTEDGQERDPDGLWLSERFHLAQFSAEIWALWLYTRDLSLLEDLYPVLREIARYYEKNVVQIGSHGRLSTWPCVDFDESVGPVNGGPFTLSGTAFALRCAADAADILGVNPARGAHWRELSNGLLASIVVASAREMHGEVFGIPDGAALHYSVLGHIFPFRTEIGSARARRSAELIHRACRSTRGWKPGLSPVYDDTNWLWAGAHLGIVHAMHGEGDLAWEALSSGPSCCGPGLVPNEHLAADGHPRVPWFTTGIGAWIYALHAVFVAVDEEATHLCHGLPHTMDDCTFDGLLGGGGVLLSGTVSGGRIERLRAQATTALRGPWRYTVPTRLMQRRRPLGTIVQTTPERLILELDIEPDRPADLL